MKIREDYNLEKLLDYGFVKIDKEKATENEDWTLSTFDYAFQIGHSRRGQFYYLLVNEKTRVLFIYATEPDGNGGIIQSPDVLIKMTFDNVFELTH